MQKIAIIGASFLQRPLVEKAKEMGLETHVFAWREGNVVEEISDYYYPISILEKEEILQECKRIKIDGIVSIGSDIAMPTVNYIADKLNLIGNSLETTKITTDKYEMRKALSQAGIPCPKFALYKEPEFHNKENFHFPVIVKPTDRSGSRGVTKVNEPGGVNEAIKKALKNSLNSCAIIEEFIVGREFSVEMISYNGVHYPLAITDKTTTGTPHFLEINHHEPAMINESTRDLINETVIQALDVIGIQYGANHTEVFLTRDNEVRIIEVAGRMAGDLIGSHMVPLSTGYDFVKAAILISLNEFVQVNYDSFKHKYSGIYYVISKPGVIKSITDYSEDYKYIIEAIPLLKEGDLVSEIIDSPDKRAGIIVYSHPSHKIEINPNDVLNFETV